MNDHKCRGFKTHGWIASESGGQELKQPPGHAPVIGLEGLPPCLCPHRSAPLLSEGPCGYMEPPHDPGGPPLTLLSPISMSLWSHTVTVTGLADEDADMVGRYCASRSYRTDSHSASCVWPGSQ